MKPLPANARKKVRFELSEEPGSRVFVAGTFNNWDPTATPLKVNPNSGHYKAVLRVPTGTHEYKFVVDGVWCMDPKSEEWVPDGYESLNSVLHA